ncbi:MAG: RDD family protein [Planctomycetaceae bacterium]|jgi:uncharacterized RDD family membrane protein YckC|nr:RDD family protein [Planctomycetaceae bacterium]
MSRPHTETQLDTFIRIITPENVSFTYQLAGPFIRLAAFLIDMLVMGLVIGLFLILISLASSYFDAVSDIMFGLFLIFTFFVTWFYGGILETFWNGQTVGKRVMRIRVLTIEGQPINSFQAVFRNILRFADLQPLFFGTAAFCFISCTKRFQRFGDWICGTMVVTEDSESRRHEMLKFKHPEVLKLSEQIPAGLPIPPTTLKVLALYVHRRRTISARRRDNIAAILALPMAEKYQLPKDVSPDLLLCAVYHASFTTGLSSGNKPEMSASRFAHREILPPMSIEN